MSHDTANALRKLLLASDKLEEVVDLLTEARDLPLDTVTKNQIRHLCRLVEKNAVTCFSIYEDNKNQNPMTRKLV